MGSDDLMYIPGVTFFKTDESQPKLKDESDWFKTDVIASAASNLGFDYDTEQFKEMMTSRIKKSLTLQQKKTSKC